MMPLCMLHGEGPTEAANPQWVKGYYLGWLDSCEPIESTSHLDRQNDADRGYLEGLRDRTAGHRPRSGVTMRCPHLILWPHECRDCERALDQVLNIRAKGGSAHIDYDGRVVEAR